MSEFLSRSRGRGVKTSPGKAPSPFLASGRVEEERRRGEKSREEDDHRCLRPRDPDNRHTHAHTDAGGEEPRQQQRPPRTRSRRLDVTGDSPFSDVLPESVDLFAGETQGTVVERGKPASLLLRVQANKLSARNH